MIYSQLHLNLKETVKENTGSEIVFFYSAGTYEWQEWERSQNLETGACRINFSLLTTKLFETR